MVPFAAIKPSIAFVRSDSCKKLLFELQAARARGHPIYEHQQCTLMRTQWGGKAESVAKMVNWQPIRQTSRIQGSARCSAGGWDEQLQLKKGWHQGLIKLLMRPNEVWQQVHDSLQGGAATLISEQTCSTTSVPSRVLACVVFRPPNSRKTCLDASCARHLRRRGQRAVGWRLTWPSGVIALQATQKKSTEQSPGLMRL